VSDAPGHSAPASNAAPAATALQPAQAVLTAAATGFGVMAAELTAVRLLAPHFGDSAYVWTNVIGVILAAMALGAVIGGRLSARNDARAWPFRLLLIAGALLLVAPYITSMLGGWLLPEKLPLDAAMPVLIRGSLVATAVVFAPPLLLLAAVSPLLIVLLAKGGSAVGKAAGDVAAAGTVGSLLGTFVATHWLVPGFGCRIAMTVAAVVMLLAAALVAPGKLRASAGVGLLLGLAMLFAHGGPLRPTADKVKLLAERETPYQFLQVQKSQPDGGPARTTLVINEGLDSFHSLEVDGSSFTAGAYYDWHAVAPLFAGDGTVAADARVLSIGDAAGTLRQIYGAVHPGVPVDAVDIDAETMALGDEFFTAPKAGGKRYAIDGRVFLSQSKEQWHVIHVDAYAHQVYVPAHLASFEFFEAAHARLHEGGILACNVGGLTLDDEVLGAVAATVGKVFSHVQVFLVPSSRNALLLARRGKPLAPASIASAAEVTGALKGDDIAQWRNIVTTCSDPSNWHTLAPENPVVLYDDKPQLDELLFESYVTNNDPREIVSCSGSRTVADAEQTAFVAMGAGKWQDVLTAVASSGSQTPYLRQLAGDARWYRREMHSAALEYEVGLELLQGNEQASVRQALTGRLEEAKRQLKPIDAAESAATRNGWLAGLISVLGVVMICVIRRG